ncbi:MAG: hypothetical protein RBS72_10365 [Sedimentisphaerales bacterium]|jgi:hypothetical protein|nr:hypothetical protein [Sedimentisphaerales bacterium]HNY76684.1 hypothetical protein [Sedimentisphaerales bacterium]HOC61709.1 hypothetical protein [Sedimentisphaerales bacterium]HOH62541.1 hypothetical protein [Sedimentisphaerales bacterium]HQA88476.1 hypothetical protein [Sedimentisphaerales bacterium]
MCESCGCIPCDACGAPLANGTCAGCGETHDNCTCELLEEELAYDEDEDFEDDDEDLDDEEEEDDEDEDEEEEEYEDDEDEDEDEDDEDW